MKMFILLALISSITSAQEVSETTFNKLKKLYPDQSSEFLKKRLEEAPGLFDKWRSFPPYYWDMLKTMPNSQDRIGLCAGDPHIENFGFLASDKGPVFTLNDLDDVATCSLDMDLMRFFVGSRMLLPSLDAKTFLDAYTRSHMGMSCVPPKFISKLEKDSIKKGRGLSKKNKAMLEAKTCIGEYAPLTVSERSMMEDFTKAENGDQSCLKSEVLSDELKALAKSVTNTDKKEIIHACSRTKSSGGSAGAKRFVVFRQSASGIVDAYELKPLQKPAPTFFSETKDSRENQFKSGVDTYLGDALKAYYYPVTLNKVLYQRRPLWGGNEEVKLEDLSSEEYEAVILYETCQLAKLHARSNKEHLKAHPQSWDKLARQIEEQFRKAFVK